MAGVFEAICPPAVSVATAAADTAPPPLFPEEAAAVAGAIAKRRREFALGRASAREALARLGATPGPIPVRPDRSPAWPDGVVGSITHGGGLVAAAVAWSRDFHGVGLDAETATPLEPELVRLVCTPAERDAFARRPPPTGTDWPNVAFSAKEAVHKALAPFTGVTLAFRDVALDFDGTGSFTMTFVGPRRPRLPDPAQVTGRYAVVDGLVLAVATVPAPFGGEQRTRGG